jgi:hypothetical protein
MKTTGDRPDAFARVIASASMSEMEVVGSSEVVLIALVSCPVVVLSEAEHPPGGRDRQWRSVRSGALGVIETSTLKGRYLLG